jgi:hypothetical protein
VSDGADGSHAHGIRRRDRLDGCGRQRCRVSRVGGGGIVEGAMKQIGFYLLAISILWISFEIDKATDTFGVTSPLYWVGAVTSFGLLVFGMELYARKGRVFAPEEVSK